MVLLLELLTGSTHTTIPLLLSFCLTQMEHQTKRVQFPTAQQRS